MQPPVAQLCSLGPFPNSDDTDVDQVKAYSDLIEQIHSPISDDDARALVTLFGPDDYFGLAFTLVHIIETAPGWPLSDALSQTSNEWIDRLQRRVANVYRDWPLEG